MLNEIPMFFDRIMGDPCTGIVLAVAAYIFAHGFLALLPFDRQQKLRIRCGVVSGVAFLLLAAIEYSRRGPLWPEIVFLSALRAWLVFSASCLLLGVLDALTRSTVTSLRFQRRARPQVRASRRSVEVDSGKDHDHVREKTVAESPTPDLPPPTLDDEIAALNAEFAGLKAAIQSTALQDDEKKARLYDLEILYSERLDSIMERHMS